MSNDNNDLNLAQFATLLKRRDMIESVLNRFIEFFEDPDNQTKITEIKMRFGKLDSNYEQFMQIQSEIQSVDEDESDKAESFEKTYYKTISAVQDFLDQQDTKVIPQTPIKTSDVDSGLDIMLPAINLPKFTGLYTEWFSFCENFNLLISTKKNMSDTRKFQYLKLCLCEEPSRVIESLPFTADNYQNAWKLLQERYENKRLICETHIRNLFNLPKITKDCYTSLRSLLDKLNSNLEALKAMKMPTDSWDALLVYIVTSNFDFITTREWEGSISTTEMPTIKQLKEFLAKRCQLLGAIEFNKTMNKNQMKETKIDCSLKDKYKRFNFNTNVSAATLNKFCPVCKHFHKIYYCKQFLKLSIQSRFEKVKELNLCLNCLKPNHSNENCFNETCSKCNKKLNRLIHVDNIIHEVSEDTSDQHISSHAANIIFHHNVILPTAEIKLMDNSGQFHLARALLDSGSQVNFITEKLAKTLKLQIKKTNASVSGINNCMTSVGSAVEVTLQSKYSNFNTQLQCLILQEITKDQPLQYIPPSSCKIPKHIFTQLADYSFNRPGKIDLLLGVEAVFSLLREGLLKLGDNCPYAQNTHLGWVIGGVIKSANFNNENPRVCHLVNETDNLEQYLTRFWELEECVNKRNLSLEEMQCEDNFTATHRRLDTGRYQVKLPFKTNTPQLGSSFKLAERQFYNLEKRFTSNPKLKRDYMQFIHEYLELNHMEIVHNTNDFDSDKVFYFPHHAVIKEDSSTTKLRVVFNGSAKTTNNKSLNDNLMVGPTLQSELFDIILRFRMHSFVFTADIKKMYRQIEVDPCHRDYQRILWRDNPSDKLTTFRLTTVTYGTASAPYQAIKCLQQLALDERHNFPLAYNAIMNNFYVDDALCGAESKVDLVKIRDELIEALARGGFELQKWASNFDELLPNRTLSDRIVQLDKVGDNKTLGLLWNTDQDTIKFAIKEHATDKTITKRAILKIVAQIYDPAGLINPLIVKAKMILQKLWALKLDWDTPVPNEIRECWIEFVGELNVISTMEFPRQVSCKFAKRLELHGFCDASEKAYGAVIYLKTVDKYGMIQVQLLCSKSRVAPLKVISIPRLELSGALLLSRLSNKVITALKSNVDIHFWTDSTIVLSWLSEAPNTWKTFVANRVSEIQSLSDIANWRHVKGQENPADILSRGAFPSQLVNNRLWHNGPDWLKTNLNLNSNSVSTEKLSSDEIIKEQRIHNCLVASHIDADFQVLHKFSSIKKLQNVVAYCQRFTYNCRNKNNKLIGKLSHSELKNSLLTILKTIQQVEFADDIRHLQNKKIISNNSKLSSLNPFLDSDGLIRVGGRLKNANVPYDNKCPIVLPAHHHITKLIALNAHKEQLHAGHQGTLAHIRQKYWPLSGRALVRKVIHSCIPCFKVKPKTITELMGDLPQARITPGRPFSNCSVDFAGPLLIKEGRGRGKRLIKSYVSIFICFATKAVHIELVSDMSTDSFLAALKRFSARRGTPSEINSDNGSNFIGANNEFKKLYNSDEFKSNLNLFCDTKQIKWNFIPPRTPNFNGLCENMVKAVKGHLKRVVSNSNLTYEEMITLLSQIEAVLNSRPLIPLSNDPNDLNYLTPGHFLIGCPLTAPPEPSLEGVNMHRLSRWQHIEQLRQHIWKRWTAEYLSTLQQRAKWRFKSPNDIKIGTLVLIKDENLPPMKWKTGRVLEIHPGADGLVRVVTLKTHNSELKRGVSKICPLPLE